MKKRELDIFFIIVLSLIVMPLINSQQPTQTQINVNTEIGLDIIFPKFNPLKVNNDFNFNIQVFNRSTSLELDNSTTNCSFHLINSSGNHIFISDPLSYDNVHNHWQVIVKGGNFSQIEEMSYIVDCTYLNSISGFASSDFEVTPTGTILETPESLLYIIILITTFILFLGFLYPAIKLPYSNKTNPDGSITKITRAKYLKLLSVWFAYGFLMWFLQILNGISKSFITLTYLSNFITNIFTYSQWFSIGITFLILTIILIEIWKDIILSNTIKRYGKAFLDERFQ